MKVNLSNKWIHISFIIASISLLTACNTVQGTVHGAGQDIKATGRAITPSREHEVTKHHKHKKTHHKAQQPSGQSQPQGTSGGGTSNTSY